MKKIILTNILSIVIVININSQNCCFPPVLNESYEIDIKHLAIVDMEMVNAQDLDSIEINESWQSPIREGLTAIFYSQSEGRNAVFDQYCIRHRFSSLRISTELYVRPDSNVTWFANWINEDIITNDLYLDSIFQKYGFYKVHKLLFTGYPTFVITTDQYLNLNPLSNVLEAHDSILFAERAGYGPCGYQKITYEKFITSLRVYEFSIGWNDCIDECSDWHKWYFSVDENCEVTYLGSEGCSEIPTSINCNISDSIYIELDTINIEFELSNSTYCIDDGNIILTGGFPIGGSYIGEGIQGNILNPNDVGIGQYYVEYQIEDANGCLHVASDDLYIVQSGCITQTTNIIDEKIIEVYPNPSHGNFVINNLIPNQPINLKLFDLNGNYILNHYVNSEKFEIADIPKGVYILEVSNKSNSQSQKIIIK